MRFVIMARSGSDLTRKVVSVCAALMVAMIFGLALAHVVELPGKLRLDGPTWLTVQQNLYVGFGPLAAVVEPLGILFTWVLACMLRKNRAVFRLLLLAALCTTAGLGEWVSVVSPMNTLLNGWTAATLPPDWTACRNQWEFGHAVHAILFGVAFCALLAAMPAMRTGEGCKARRA
jgi:L-cystine uptake protein TcyP (sodium:dicarboxylate symporter family)